MPILEENEIFERYSVIQLLGSGVSGESYEAKDSILQQKVTLKLIHPWTILPETAQRQFFREMRGISRLQHPYLASVFDYGISGGRLYVARRYTSSSSLLGNEGRLWFRSPFTVPDAIRYGHQLAQALAYIHSKGFLHGALTFTNILVLRGPNVDDEPDYAPFLLADIGVANFVRRFGYPQITLLPITAAPEQLGMRVTPASDQFALAVMIFSWLAGRPPYLGSPEEVEHLKLTETIASLRSFNPKVTAEQESILRRALAVYPDERYPSIVAFTEALLATIVPQPQFTMPPITTPLPEVFPLPESPTEPQPVAEPSPVSVSESAPTFEFLMELLFEPQPTAEFQSTPPTEPIVQEELLSEQEPSPPTQETLPERPAHFIITSPYEELPSEQEPPQPTQEVLPERPAHFIITSPYAEEPREVILEGDEITIGRAGSSHILLDQDSLTSRHHALLKRKDEHYILYDQRSVSGTFVNGQKLTDDEGYILSDGDHVRISKYELVFRCSAHSAIH